MGQKKQTYGMSLKIQHANITLHLFFSWIIMGKKNKLTSEVKVIERML